MPSASSRPSASTYHWVAELVHDRELVLHHDDRRASLAQADKLHANLVGQARVHARHRLVQQQDLRLGHQRAHDLNQSPLSAAEVAGVPIGQRQQAKLLQGRGCPVDRVTLLRAPVALAEHRPAEALALLVGDRGQQVLEHGEALEFAGQLERSHQPQLRRGDRRAVS